MKGFQSHGMRPLARAIRRRNDDFVTQRPTLPDDPDLKAVKEKDIAKFNEHFRGHLRFYSQGESIYTEGTFVTWDIDFPEIYRARMKDYFDQHMDVLTFTILCKSLKYSDFFKLKVFWTKN